MKKVNRIFLCVFILVVLPLAACTEPRGTKNVNRFNGERDEKYAVHLDEALTCHNTWLGITYTIPKGWWVYDLNSSNFFKDQDETANPLNLDIIYGNDNTHIELVSFANVSSSAKKNHLGFEMNAIRRDGTRTIEGYMPGFEAYMVNMGGGEILAPTNHGAVVIGEITFERRVFEVPQPTGTFMIMTLSAPLKQGYFLNIIVDYWQDWKNAESAIFSAINDALVLE